MRTDIIEALDQGEVVPLIANRRDLRDYAKRELGFVPARGR
jgi:hypothetical protein